MIKESYKYNDKTFEYLGIVPAYQNPKRPGEFVLPAYATFTTPLKIKVGKAIVWDVQLSEWKYIEDNRGKTIYSKEDSRKTEIQPSNLTDSIPDDYTLTAPPDNEKWYKFNNDTWEYYFPPYTKHSLSEWLYSMKSNIAYTGIHIIQNKQTYTFETSMDSITMCNSTTISLINQQDSYKLYWKVYQNDQSTFLQLTKSQFAQIFSFGMTMINQAFAVESEQNAIVASMTDEQLADEEFIINFKSTATAAFEAINKTYELVTIK